MHTCLRFCGDFGGKHQGILGINERVDFAGLKFRVVLAGFPQIEGTHIQEIQIDRVPPAKIRQGLQLIFSTHSTLNVLI